ncbi:MAG: glutamate racemase [Cellvibrionaceae bacterium]
MIPDITSSIQASPGAIGIFDSGIGGLSVALKVREALPAEDIIYVADSAHAPYGEKSTAYIQDRSHAIADFLVEKGIKALVVACNTATVSTIADLRERYSFPIIGVEPGVKPATFQSSSGVVGVLATTQTLNSNAFADLTARFSGDVEVILQPCPGLVERVESLHFGSDETEDLLRTLIYPLLDRGADHIVLGCTHYGFVEPAIRKIVGPSVEVINTDAAIAREVARRLDLENLLSNTNSSDFQQPSSGVEFFYTSGNASLVTEQVSHLWGKSVLVQKVF